MSAALDFEKSLRSITPDSWNSIQRSLPSRVRSPTPAKTEKPPCLVATLLMSSWMMTVLPTPAPPKRPILPPFKNGWMRSITLMPVSNISSWVDCSSNAGAWRWMGRCTLALTGPSSSTGWPRTLSTRPRDACAGVDRLHASDHAFGCDHRDAAHAAFAEVLLYLDDDIERGGDVEAFADDANRLEDRRHFRLFKLNVNGRAADRNYFSNVL